MKILIVEDNEIISNNIRDYLKVKKVDSKQLFDGGSVIFEIVSNSYDAIILDIGLGGDKNGLEICRDLRDKGYDIPIIMLTARTTTKDKIIGLKDGADDYLTKPFDYEELLMRLNAIIRRTFSQKSENISIGEVKIELEKKQVLKNGKVIELSSKEFELLSYLAKNKGKIISKETLLEKVWGKFDQFENSRNVDVYVGYLRKKLSAEFIKTKRGEGYFI